MTRDEQEIINALKQGDNHAYKHIYDHHYVLLCKIAYEFLRDDFLAETIVSETISHLYEIRETLHITSSLRSYLVRAVRNRCINHLNLEYKKRERRLTTIDNTNEWLHTIAQSEEHPLGILLEQELESEIFFAIEKLPDECRRVFKMSRFEEKSYEEIAVNLNISVNTVKYHIKNALAKLTQSLNKYLLFLLLYESLFLIIKNFHLFTTLHSI